MQVPPAIKQIECRAGKWFVVYMDGVSVGPFENVRAAFAAAPPSLVSDAYFGNPAREDSASGTKFDPVREER
jgi:hypothetical protein